MLARFVVVHDDPEFTDALVEKLGEDVAWFTDPIRALTALEAARTVAFLITRLQFADSQPVGLSLARLARATRPDVRVVFIGLPQYRDFARGLGEFIAEPVNATHVGMIIEWLSTPHDEPSNVTGPDAHRSAVVRLNHALEGRRAKP